MSAAQELPLDTHNEGDQQPVGLFASAPVPAAGREGGAGLGKTGAPLTETEYADSFRLALTVEDYGRARTVQTDGGILGGSDAMSCSAKAIYTLSGTAPTNIPRRGQAQAGTYLHAGTLAAVQELYPDRLIEQSLTVTLPSGLQVPLHPDEIDPSEPSVTDYKFVGDLALNRRTPLSDQKHAQRNLQYLAAHQAGLVPAEGIVRNLFVNVADMDDVWVQQEPFDMAWVHAADDWYQSVIYAATQGEEGTRDWPEPLCRHWCPWYDACRPPISELEQEITIPELRHALQAGYAAQVAVKENKPVLEQAKDALRGVSGRVTQPDGSRLVVRSTTVNAKTGPYVKTELREVK